MSTSMPPPIPHEARSFLSALARRTACVAALAWLGACAGPASRPPVAGAPVGHAQVAAITFMWPANGTVLKPAGAAKHPGIDIGGRAGQPVVAAAGGRVVYAGNGLRGYGNFVIIKHDETYLSAYGHNRTLLVKEGDVVRQGQQIAEMGDSDADRVMLHFEIRRKGASVDPLVYLPPR